MCRCYACCVNVVLRVGFLYKQSICVLESVSHISCYHPIFHQPFLRVTLLLFSEQLGESPATSNIIIISLQMYSESGEPAGIELQEQY